MATKDKILKSKKKVLYFIRGAQPTEEEIEDSNNLSGNVIYRNGTRIDDTASLEPADEVAGYYPARYDGVSKCHGGGKQATDELEAKESGTSSSSSGDSGSEDPKTVQDLKAALDVLGVEYESDAKKADLVTLYEEASA